MVESIRGTEQALGTGEKRTRAVEEELRTFARRAIFTVRRIARGEQITADDLAVLRRGKLGAGLPPSMFDGLIGRRAARDMAMDHLLEADDLE
jgi:N-acetylneuraminate synthase